MRDVVPWPGIKPRPPALGTWSLSHWTTREVPQTVPFWAYFTKHQNFSFSREKKRRQGWYRFSAGCFVIWLETNSSQAPKLTMEAPYFFKKFKKEEKQFPYHSFPNESHPGTSLTVQWLSHRASDAGDTVQSLVRELRFHIKPPNFFNF